MSDPAKFFSVVVIPLIIVLMFFIPQQIKDEKGKKETRNTRKIKKLTNKTTEE